MATNYQRGAARERKLVALLRDKGYYAERTAGSHGVADVIALKGAHYPLLIQVKCTQSKWSGFGPEDRCALVDAADVADGKAVLCWWPTNKQPEYYTCDWNPSDVKQWEVYDVI